MLLLESKEIYQEKLKTGNFQAFTYQDLQQMIINKIHQSEIQILDERISSSSPGITLALKADHALMSEFLSWELLQMPELLEIRELKLRQEGEEILLDFIYELAENALLFENYPAILKERRFLTEDKAPENLSENFKADLERILKYRLTEGEDAAPGNNHNHNGNGLPKNFLSYQYQQPETEKTRITVPSRTGGEDSSPENNRKLPSSISWRGFISGVEKDFYLFETPEGSLVLSPGDSRLITLSGQEVEVKLKINENKIYLHIENLKYLLGQS